jgi:hypothetical protein
LRVGNSRDKVLGIGDQIAHGLEGGIHWVDSRWESNHLR